MEPLSDESSLVAACQRGDLTQFDPLYRHYVKPLYAFILRRTLVREIAEDLTSISFMKAIEKIGSFRSSKAPFSVWLYSIARNAITDHFRSKHQHTSIDDVWDLPSSDDVHATATDSMNYEKIRTGLQKLDKSKRDIVLMRVWDGLSYKEIAALTGKTETNCKVIFSRALEQLRADAPLLILLLILLSPLFS